MALDNMTDCIFCNIAKGEVATKQLYQDDKVVAFADIHPQAKHHVIIIPRKHIATLNHAEAEDSLLLGEMVLTAVKLAKEIGIADQGYRLVWNCNSSGGQTVYHIHLHLIGGRQMTWPPG